MYLAADLPQKFAMMRPIGEGAKASDLSVSPFGQFREIESLTQEEMRDIKVESTTYQFTRPVQGSFLPRFRKFFTNDIPGIVGDGNTFQEAKDSWSSRFNERVQELLATRPFEMTDEQYRFKVTVDSLVDWNMYKSTNAVIVKQRGKVVGHRGNIPTRFRWSDGSTWSVPKKCLPSNGAKLRPGERFEAELRIDPDTSEIIEVVSITARDPAPSTRDTITFIKNILDENSK